MAKKTCPYCDGKKGRHESWGTHGKGWYKCNTCDGKGFIFTPDEPRPQREKKEREPRPQREPKQREERPQRQQRDSNWREKTCSAPGCYNTIHYHKDWTNIPTLCDFHRSEKKNEWLEKPCKTNGCSGTVRYNINWEHIPNFCPACKEAHKQRDSQSKSWTYGLSQQTQQVTLSDGTVVTFGPCTMPNSDAVGARADEQRGFAQNGYWFVSLPNQRNHTTFIVTSDDASIVKIKSRGADTQIWRTLAIAIR